MKLNYKKLMTYNPTVYDTMINCLGQNVLFVEHPTRGDEYPVICVFPELELAFASDFYETDDMMASHKEYEPSVQDGKFHIGEFEQEN